MSDLHKVIIFRSVIGALSTETKLFWGGITLQKSIAMKNKVHF